jgi:predicted ATPase
MVRYIIAGPAGSGKTTLARKFAESDPSIVIYDDPAPRIIVTGGSWIYVCQDLSSVIAGITIAADTILTHIPGTAHEFIQRSVPRCADIVCT